MTGRLQRVNAGYSGTPLVKKLGIKDGQSVAVLGAPTDWTIPGLGPDVTIRHDLRVRADVIIAFIGSRAELRQMSPRVVRALRADAAMWLAWPRKAGGHVSDVTEQSLRDELLPVGVVDTKVAALDDDWSGLRFVWRREHRLRLAT